MHRIPLGRLVAAVWLVATLSAGAAVAGPQAPAAPGSGAAWSQGYALVVVDDGAHLDAARQLVQARGGAVALLLPPRYLTGWIPPELDGALVGHAGIRAIHRDGAIDLPEAADPAGRAAVRFFARAQRGELDMATPTDTPTMTTDPHSADPDADPTSADSSDDPYQHRPDAWSRGAVSEFDIAANLSRLGIAPPQRKGTTSLFGSGSSASLASNSDFMTGTVSVTLFFVESDGSGSDPDVFDWTSSAEEDAFADAAAALSWWASQAQQRSGCWVVFRLEAHFATEDPRCAQWREPTLHASSDYASAIQQVLGNFGYTIGGHLARASAFAAAMRVQKGTDWAFAAFAAANPTGPRQFTDGYAAWAYLGGPYLAFLQRSFGWSVKQVFAHESGHIFRACDEYYTPEYGGCTDCGGCADTGVPNGNCESCNSSPESCMMRANTWVLCDWTVGQIGWWRNPCTDSTYPAPHIDSATPSDLVQGLEADIEVHGDFFSEGSTATFGADIETLSQQVISENLLQARIRVPLEAAPGDRDVVVIGPDGQLDVLADALHIRVTPRHYVSQAGGNAFPFDRPESAATDLAAVLAACSSGDTILLAGGTYGPVSLKREVTIIGGWADGFGARLPDVFPSVLDADGTGPALRIDTPGVSPVLDGLILRGGRGALLSTPELGPMPMGGALLAIDCAPTLRDCRLESSQAGDASTPGAGGGAFFWRANPRLERCTVRANGASRGAGLFFLRCDAFLKDVVVEANDGGGAGIGAGIAALASRIDMQGGRVADNLGAQDGGGLHLDSCASVRLERTVVDANDAARWGGGVASRASRIEAVAVRLTRNQAGDRGGGLHATGDSLVLESTVVGGNSAATLAGGLHLSSCQTTLLNVTIAANDGGPVSGVYWANAPAAGSVRNCIVAHNTLGGFAVSGGVAPLADYNTFVANGAMNRSGITPGPHDLDVDPRFVSLPVLDFGLGLDSPALDTGDPAPENADVDGSRNDRGAHGGPRAASPAPAHIQGVAAAHTTGAVRVTWESSRMSNIESYVVYRDTIASFRAGESMQVARLAAPATSWFDAEAPPNAWYIVVVVDSGGHASGPSLAAQPSPPSDAAGSAPAFALHTIAPNPANPGAWIDYELAAAGAAQIAVFTARGARIRLLQAGPTPAGRRRLYWDGRDDGGRAVASGVYWVRLLTASEHRSRKLVVVR